MLQLVDESKEFAVCILASNLHRVGKLGTCEMRHLWVMMN